MARKCAHSRNILLAVVILLAVLHGTGAPISTHAQDPDPAYQEALSLHRSGERNRRS